MSEQEQSEQFIFQIQEKQFIQEKEDQQKLFKWQISNLRGMKDSFSILSFRFNLTFQEIDAKQFLKDLLNDTTVQNAINTAIGLSGSVQNFEFQPVKCSTTNMSLFDRLESEGITARGNIKGTYDDYVDGIHIQTLLREMLVKEESEYFEIYSNEDKQQLLFILFQHLVLGGCMSQPDDKIESYVDITKKIYKNLVWQFFNLVLGKTKEPTKYLLIRMLIRYQKLRQIYEIGNLSWKITPLIRLLCNCQPNSKNLQYCFKQMGRSLVILLQNLINMIKKIIQIQPQKNSIIYSNQRNRNQEFIIYNSQQKIQSFLFFYLQSHLSSIPYLFQNKYPLSNPKFQNPKFKKFISHKQMCQFHHQCNIPVTKCSRDEILLQKGYVCQDVPQESQILEIHRPSYAQKNKVFKLDKKLQNQGFSFLFAQLERFHRLKVHCIFQLSIHFEMEFWQNKDRYY